MHRNDRRCACRHPALQINGIEIVGAGMDIREYDAMTSARNGFRAGNKGIGRHNDFARSWQL